MNLIWAMVAATVASGQMPAENPQRPNMSLSVEDLPAESKPAPRRLPAQPQPGDESALVPVERVDYNGMPLSPQVQATPLPGPSDGLAGNRQVALTPFPNLYLQSGPLAKHQLPWVHPRTDDSPFSILKTLEYNTAIGAFESNGHDDDNGAWYNSVQIGLPFWREREVGLQLGVSVEPTGRPQIFTEITAGFFRRAIWAPSPQQRTGLSERLSWGMAYDGLFDTEDRGFIGQNRTQIGYLLGPDREVGGWLVLPMHNDNTPASAEVALTIGASAMLTTYYRRTYANELDVTWLLGMTESPGSAHTGAYVTYRFSDQASWILSGMGNYDREGGFAVYTGLRFHFWPDADYSTIAGSPQKRYRPFLPMADHINFQVRKRPN